MPLLRVWLGLALAALGHGFLWAAVINRIHGCAGPRRLIKAVTLGALAAILGLPLVIAARLAFSDQPLARAFVAGDWTAAYLWICIAFAVASLAAKIWLERHRFDRSVLLECQSQRRDPPRRAATAAVGDGARPGLLARIPGNDAWGLSVDRKRLAIPRLPAELEGLTIVHLSDLHMTDHVGRDYFIHLAKEVNALRPDVIAITGDIIEKERCRPWLAESLGSLCAPLGVYFILGNHDDFVDAEQTRRELIDMGLVCLSRRWVRAEWNGAAVILGGNELPWMTPAADLAALPPRDADGAEFRLVLSHTPDQFGWCERADADLALAGHTHGGQVQLPLLGIIASPSLYGTRYACGVFRRGSTVLHVTRGVGGETPFRWRCPPEAALLTLTAGAPNA